MLPRFLFSIGNAYHKVNQQRGLVWCFEVVYALHIEDGILGVSRHLKFP